MIPSASSPWPHDPAFAVPDSALEPLPQPPDDPACSLWVDNESPGDIAFRRSFALPAAPLTATLGLSSGSTPEVHVNGRNIPGILLSPSRYTRQYDIAPWLRKGRNVIAVRDPADVRRSASFAAVLIAAFADGSRQRLRSDASWKAAEGILPADWFGENFDDTSWSAANVRGPLTTATSHICYWPEVVPRQGWLKQIPLAATDIRTATDTTQSSPLHRSLIEGSGAVAFPAGAEGWREWQRTLGEPVRRRLEMLEALSPGVLVDFGRCINGRVQISGDPESHCLAVVSLGESAAEALRGPDVHLQTLFIPAGGSSATFESGFRFARIHFVSLPGRKLAAPRGVEARFIFSPMSYRGRFHCADTLLNDIWHMGAYTVRLNFQDEVWDANKRDRHPFTGDLVPQEAVARVAFDDPAVIRHSLAYLARQVGLPGEARNHINGISTYSALWVDNLYRDYRQTGDLDFLRSQKDNLLGLLKRLEKDLDETGAFRNRLGGWPFVDWSPGLWHRPNIAPLTEAQLATAHAMMHGAVCEAVEMLAALGEDDEMRRLEHLAERMKKAAFASFWDAASGTFGERKHPNAAAIYFGLVDARQARHIDARVLSRPFSGEYFPDWLQRDRSGADRMSPYFTFYLMEARTLAGARQQVLDFLRAYWGEMIRRGATTTWENFNPADQPSGEVPGYGPDWNVTSPDESFGMSLMHGWSAGATYWLSRHVLGVQESSPGFASAVLRPFLGSLPWAEGTVPTPRGGITVRHEQHGGTFTTTAAIPAGIKTLAGIPKTSGPGQCTCGEQTATPHGEDDDYWYFQIPDGVTSTLTACGETSRR